MKVLFLHPNTADYLISGLFHGLRKVLGEKCVDLPRFDCMYKPYTAAMRSKIRGNGFTLYGLLEDLPQLAEERFLIWFKNIKDYDLYVIADIWNNWEPYNKLKELVPSHKIVIIDSSDSPRIFPFINYRNKTKSALIRLSSPIHKSTKYFKREFSNSPKDYFGMPGWISKFLKDFLFSYRIYPISFSIPEEKISFLSPIKKNKLFVNNIVDEEISRNVPESFFTPLGKEVYKFENEEEYYSDIQTSKFGITTKRAGWDCLRHYEYAANGAVLCFKDLKYKHLTNAPYGLDLSNCIIYDTYEDLINKISKIDDLKYAELLTNTYTWIRQNTTTELAKKFLNISLASS